MTRTKLHARRVLSVSGVLAAVVLTLSLATTVQAAPAHVGAPSRADAAGTAAAGTAAGTAAGARTVVTFTWGGGFANQLGSLPVFRHYGMHATFYVPSGLVCVPDAEPGCARSPYLTLDEVHQIANAGNEIGGLTVEHVPITGIPAAEAQREICNDRVNLTRWGFRVTDFAYPFALVTRTLQVLAQHCGYNSGLGTGQLRGAGLCTSCPRAETIPPANPYLLRTPIEVASVGTRWTPATFEKIVTDARDHGGGWIIFTIHDVCARGCALGVTAPELRSVLGWLSGQAGTGVSVRTVRQVIGGPVRAAVSGPRPQPVPPPGVTNSRLAAVAANGIPACFQAARYGKNQAAFRYEPHGGPDGAAAEVVSLTQRQSGTAQLLPTLDLGACAPTVAAGSTYRVGAWYKSSQPVVFNVYYRTPVGTWNFWVSSPSMPASQAWTEQNWTTPAVPAGASAVSFGLALNSDGTVATSRYSLTGPSGSGGQLSLFGLVSAALVGAALVVIALVGAAAAVRRLRHRRARAGTDPD